MVQAFFTNSSTNKSVCRVDARSKILLLFLYSVSLFFVASMNGLFLMFILFLTLVVVDYFLEYRQSKQAFLKLILAVLKVSIPLYLICAFSFLANAMSFTGFSTLGDLPGGDAGISSGILVPTFVFTKSGVYNGAFYVIRVLLLGWSSLFVANTLSLLDFASVFKWVFWPTRKLKVPVSELALSVSIALRFIPEIFNQFLSVKEAQWCRGASMDYGGLIKRTSAYCGCFVPLIVRMMCEVDDLADALTMRSWGLFEVSPSEDFQKVAFSQKAFVVIISMCVVLIAALL